VKWLTTVRFWAKIKDFSLRHLDRLWGLHNLLIYASFPGGKGAEA